jgi:hypothetical protein
MAINVFPREDHLLLGRVVASTGVEVGVDDLVTRFLRPDSSLMSESVDESSPDVVLSSFTEGRVEVVATW